MPFSVVLDDFFWSELVNVAGIGGIIAWAFKK
jgi:hypothetical protein